MVNSRVATRYAKSLLDLAVDKGILQEVHADMVLFNKVSKENPSLVTMLRNPIINHSKKKAVLYAVFKGKVTPSTLAIFDILTRKNRENYLPGIAEAFIEQYREHQGIVKATVTTAFPLTEALRAQFEDLVKKKSGKKVELEEKVDTSIIGGYILKIGDQQMDNSIRTKLKVLKHEFSDDSFVKAI